MSRTTRDELSGGSNKPSFGIRHRYILYLLVLSFLVGTSTFRFMRLEVNVVDNAPSLIVPNKNLKEDGPSTIVVDKNLKEDDPSTIVVDKNIKEDGPSTIVSSDIRKDAIDWSDVIFFRREWDNDPVVIESHKLLFFTVPKNSCTTFKKLFRRMMGYQNWFDGEAHDPNRNGLRYLGHYSREKQEEFVTSPDWTRAIFVRDPMERTLSAYMDKALHTFNYPGRAVVEGAHVKHKCCDLKSKIPACKEFPLSPWKNPLTVENFPFDSFVNSLMTQCDDPHWRPQSSRMRNQTNWKIINFVGHFDTIQDDTRRLLERIGAYEEFGSTGWGKGSNKNASIFERNIANHKTGSGDKMKQHYTPELKKLVMEYYQQDYDLEVFNITKPFD